MFRILFRFLLWTFAFYFIYKFIQKVLRTFIREPKKPVQSPEEPQVLQQDEPKYGDVQDAIFKDIPKDAPKQ